MLPGADNISTECQGGDRPPRGPRGAKGGLGGEPPQEVQDGRSQPIWGLPQAAAGAHGAQGPGGRG